MIQDQIEGIVENVLRKNNIEIKVTKDVALLEECGLDSIMAIEILVEIEKKFNIVIDDEDLDLALLKNIKTLTEYVQNKINQ